MFKIFLLAFLLIFISGCHQGSSYISRYGQSIVLNPEQTQNTQGTTETISDQKLIAKLKNKVGAEWFKQFDTTEILGNIDFTVFPKQDSLFGRTPLLWAEAKTGNFDIPAMFVQLILTIGKARTFDKTLPPAFLGAFDFKKIAFVDYVNIQDIFYINDFNWNVTPSDHETKEFQLIKERIESILKTKTYVFDYQKDEKLLNTFIKNSVASATTKSKIKVFINKLIKTCPVFIDI